MCNKVPIDHPFAKSPPYYSQFVARAHENRCWLVGADWVWPNDGKVVCLGHSAIYNSDGEEIVRSLDGKKQCIIADILKGQLFHEKGRRVYGSAILGQEIKKYNC
jgi:predicted amidohydrolase